MNIENAKQEFLKYLEQYDASNKRFLGKREHSFRVMKEAEEIAKSLNLSYKEIEIAQLIGLLHDIGRFEQVKTYDTYEDYKSIDHGDYGVEVLTKNNYIRKYIEESDYDNIILKAIKNHNKFEIEEGLTEKELLFAKLIRDADKLDIFYEGVEFFWSTEEERKKVSESEVSKEVLEQFKKGETIRRENVKTPADDVVGFIAFIYDINFEYSYNKIKKQHYIEEILSKFSIKNFSIDENNILKNNIKGLNFYERNEQT